MVRRSQRLGLVTLEFTSNVRLQKRRFASLRWTVGSRSNGAFWSPKSEVRSKISHFVRLVHAHAAIYWLPWSPTCALLTSHTLKFSFDFSFELRNSGIARGEPNPPPQLLISFYGPPSTSTSEKPLRKATMHSRQLQNRKLHFRKQVSTSAFSH